LSYQQCANDAVNGSPIKQRAETSVDRDYLHFMATPRNPRPAKTIIRHALYAARPENRGIKPAFAFHLAESPAAAALIRLIKVLLDFFDIYTILTYLHHKLTTFLDEPMTRRFHERKTKGEQTPR
jgi:hypothetical protein